MRMRAANEMQARRAFPPNYLCYKTERTSTSAHYDPKTADSNFNEFRTPSLQASAGMPVRKVCGYSILDSDVWCTLTTWPKRGRLADQKPASLSLLVFCYSHDGKPISPCYKSLYHWPSHSSLSQSTSSIPLPPPSPLIKLYTQAPSTPSMVSIGVVVRPTVY